MGVKVIYKSYLHSFEELYRTLGCTLLNHPRRQRHGSGRPLMRGMRTSSKVKEEDGSDKSSVSSQEGGDVVIKKEELCDEIDLDGVKQKSDSEEKKVKKSSIPVEKIVKDEPLEEETEIFDTSKKSLKESNKGKKAKEERMLTRPRRDSSSSLAAATELKAKKDEIGEPSKPRKDSKKEMKKIKVEKVEKVEEEDKSDTASNGSR